MKYEYRHAEILNTDAINLLAAQGFRVVANTDDFVLMEREIWEIKIPGEYGHTKLALCELEVSSYQHGLAVGTMHPEYAVGLDEEKACKQRIAARKVLFDAFPDED